MLIDAHVHLLPDRLIAAIRRWFDDHLWDIQYRKGVEECIATLRAGSVDRMVALPYAHKPGVAAALNDFTREVASRHAEVVPCCTVFPGEEGDAKILDDALAGWAHGVKIHCHVMKIAPDDPRLEPVWRASAQYRKPIVIHCGREPSAPGYGIDVHTVSGAARLRPVLEKHPDAIVIVPHMGTDEYVEFEQMLGEYPNLYLDTTMAISGYFPLSADLQTLRRWPDRILYGTDFPNLPYEWDRELKVLRRLALPQEVERKILGGNAARLFGIQ